jgi:hypothetical protein
MKTRARLACSLVSLVFAADALAVPVTLPSIANADFETGAAGFTTFPGYTGGSNPAEIPSWTGSGNRGINPTSGGSTPFRDNGFNSTHVAFLQGNGSTISQSVAGWEIGENYRVAFNYNARSGSTGSSSPFVGVTATAGASSFIDVSAPPVGGSNAYYSGNILLTAASTTNVISFTSNVTSGDKTLLVDNVRVFRNGPTILDNGFENPVQPANQFEQATGTGGGTLAGSQWGITGGAGITRNLSPFQNGGIRAPEGDQHALIQSIGSFQQTITGFDEDAVYELSLLTMARQGQSFGNDLEVILDLGLPTETFLIDISQVTFSRFTEVTSSLFTATKDSYTLTIRTTLNGGRLTGDRTTFFDNVWFNQIEQPVLAIPEPASASLAMLGLGFAALGRRSRPFTRGR